jgi:hypothetical protein
VVSAKVWPRRVKGGITASQVLINGVSNKGSRRSKPWICRLQMAMPFGDILIRELSTAGGSSEVSLGHPSGHPSGNLSMVPPGYLWGFPPRSSTRNTPESMPRRGIPGDRGLTQGVPGVNPRDTQGGGRGRGKASQVWVHGESSRGSRRVKLWFAAKP